jgi:hypothetical protein
MSFNLGLVIGSSVASLIWAVVTLLMHAARQ